MNGARCPDCWTTYGAGDAGTTCRACGRGIIKPLPLELVGRFTVRRVPNSPAARAAMARIKSPGWRSRSRGRGHRWPRWPNDPRYWQSLPLELASWLMIYYEPPAMARRWLPIVYRLEFVRLEDDGRPRLRLLEVAE